MVGSGKGEREARQARQARAKEKKKMSARFRIGESSWRRGDRAGSGEARRTSLAFIRIRSRRAPHVGQSDASGNASAGRSHTQIHKIEGEKLFPINGGQSSFGILQTFSKTSVCRSPKKFRITSRHDHSRPHQARGTTLASGHLKARHRRWW